MKDIRKMAKAFGVKSFGKSKVMLVREIQKREGNFDCFARVTDHCDQFGCCFREACFKEAAKTSRNRKRKTL